MGQARFLEQDGPLELLQEILFHANSIQDAYSLSMTCKRMQDAWLSNNCGIRVAWAVVERAVPAAELALIAHRAAKDALERERTSAVTSNGSLDPREMSSRRRVPKPEEFKAVWTLHDLAMSLEARFRQTRYQKPDDRPWGSAPEQLHRMAEWRLGMHKAIYRSLITGAALASLYKAIFVAAMKRPELRLDETRLPDIPAEREAFLRNFSALRQPMTEAEEEEAFGIYGQWLLNELQGDQDVKLAMENAFSKDCGRARSCREREKHDGQSCPVQLTAGGSHHEAHSVALELMRLLWTCSEVIRGLLSGSAAGKAENVVGRYALIVPFGRFSAWMVARCSLQEGDCAPLHIGRPVRVGGEVDSLPWITSQLFEPAGQTQANGWWAPPVAFNFFAYFLRKHMNLAFRDNFFRTVRILDTEDDWTSFTQSLFIFALDDVVGRETYYPLWASHNWLPRNGFLDGGDLLTSYESNNKH